MDHEPLPRMTVGMQRSSFKPRWVLWLTLLASPSVNAEQQTITLSIVGTNDLHGHLEALPTFSGFLANLRVARAKDGAVILLDAGDMFQGTLESNLEEGAAVITAYNTLGYSAAAIGNHEFDFGPLGPAPSARHPGDDPRGALKARAAQAQFPFLMANVVERSTGRRPNWPNFKQSHLLNFQGLTVGIIGVVTPETARSALPSNVAGLQFRPLTPTVIAETRHLRKRGATVVILVAHEGGHCRSDADPDDLTLCDPQSAIFKLAHALPPKTVDAIVAGHTHQALAHCVAGIPIIEAYANGRAFGRIDLQVNRDLGIVLRHRLFPPQALDMRHGTDDQPEFYEGNSVLADQTLQSLLAPAFARAKARGEQSLGVEVKTPWHHHRSVETALGNWWADRMLETHPKTDLAILNGGGLRAGFPVGMLTYGRLYETFPFDNHFVFFHLTAKHLRKRLARALNYSPTLPSIAGLRINARCVTNTLEVSLFRPDGSPIPDDTSLHILTTDYLANGGDGLFQGITGPLEVGPPVRETVAELVEKNGPSLRLADRQLLDPQRPRITLPRPVPVRCTYKTHLPSVEEPIGDR